MYSLHSQIQWSYTVYKQYMYLCTRTWLTSFPVARHLKKSYPVCDHYDDSDFGFWSMFLWKASGVKFPFAEFVFSSRFKRESK